MTRRLAAVPTEPEVQCLLCGRAAETYADLCNACAQAFTTAADRIAGQLAAAHTAATIAAAGDLIDHVPGQLQLTDEPVCLCGHPLSAHLDPTDRIELVVCESCTCELWETE